MKRAPKRLAKPRFHFCSLAHGPFPGPFRTGKADGLPTGSTHLDLRKVGEVRDGKGDRLTAELLGDGHLYSALVTSAQFVKIHRGKAELGKSFGNDRMAFRFQPEADENGDCRLPIQRGL